MSEPATVDRLRAGFIEPPADARPMIRWWWFGPSVERDELERELTAISAAGFGGVEVAFVYPLSPVQHPFLSREFREVLGFAAQTAVRLGLRFSLTLGSGWSYGGPHIDNATAAKRLHWERREIGADPVQVPVGVPWPGDRLLAAWVADGTVREPESGYEELVVKEGAIRIPAGRGPRVVLLAYERLTGQNVKRAAAGAEGPVLDHYSAAAVEKHLEHVAEPLLSAVPVGAVDSVFCDSLEVYGSDWTPDVLSEFSARRGYELRPRLYQLVVDGEEAARLRADYFRTLTELYEENFVARIRRWAASHGVPFRIQGYGVPPAGVSSYRFADRYEGEGWGWKEITQTRWASSAAHVYGKEVVSSEAWTWVHSPSFRATPLDLKGEAHEHFLLGINQLIGHGWPYSPSDAPGVGWFFYAAGAIDDRNPWWAAMPQLNEYLQRISWMLRQGRHVADVKVYVPAGDVFPTMGGGDEGGPDLWRSARRYIGPEIPRVLREYGLDFDLIDDDAAKFVPVSDASVVVLPFARTIPPATRRWLEEVITAGGSVISLGAGGVEGAIVDGPDPLLDILRHVIKPDVTFTPPAPEVGFVHRRIADTDLYFVANTGNRERRFRFTPRSERQDHEMWDPVSTQVQPLDVRSDQRVTLQPYEATVIVGFDGTRTRVPQTNVELIEHAIELNGRWRVSYADRAERTGPAAVSLPHRWETERSGYSGCASYDTTFTIDGAPFGRSAPEQVLLDFGAAQASDAVPGESRHIRGRSFRAHLSAPIGEVAVVTVNGVRSGVLWAPPYVVDITEHARVGTNALRIEVFNTGANALAADSSISEWAELSRELYGRRFRNQDLERALDGVSSGLFVAPTVRLKGAPRA